MSLNRLNLHLEVVDCYDRNLRTCPLPPKKAWLGNSKASSVRETSLPAGKTVAVTVINREAVMELLDGI